ncbi:hypothetical protein [Marinomonas sp.]|uniref:hypothetical protein n=1 Tax=Marinomonas sp. TaxID=1904862 RepID=UPI003BA9F78D
MEEGYAVLLVEGEWQSLEDHRGKIAYKKYGSGAFEIEELGELPSDVSLTPPCTPEPTFEERFASTIAQREAAYKTESDPLYMEWQYDGTAEAEQKWRDKVAEIKERYPLPTE